MQTETFCTKCGKVVDLTSREEISEGIYLDVLACGHTDTWSDS